MNKQDIPVLSVVVPVLNEADGIVDFHHQLSEILDKITNSSYTIVYVDDGSTDQTLPLISNLAKADKRIQLVVLSRNFGKENALSAGITNSRAQAIMTIDGDGQHPIDLIPDFYQKWQDGHRVIVGIRHGKSGLGFFKRLGSRAFYTVFNRLSGVKLMPGSTDFTLIDQSVQTEFLKLGETDRITRGLIDWLGFSPVYIYFEPKERNSGSSTYDFSNLVKLAVNSFTSLSPKPLYIFGYLGVLITILSFVIGVAIIFEQILLNDPLNWNFTGTAMLGIMLMFLIGIVLMSQGILSLYVSNINNQAKSRPLYVVDRKNSVGLQNKDVQV